MTDPSQREIRHPDVTVHLSTGCDGNIGAVMARITEGLRRGGYANEQDAFRKEIFNAESYDHALRICMRWVHVT